MSTSESKTWSTFPSPAITFQTQSRLLSYKPSPSLSKGLIQPDVKFESPPQSNFFPRKMQVRIEQTMPLCIAVVFPPTVPRRFHSKLFFVCASLVFRLSLFVPLLSFFRYLGRTVPSRKHAYITLNPLNPISPRNTESFQTQISLRIHTG